MFSPPPRCRDPRATVNSMLVAEKIRWDPATARPDTVCANVMANVMAVDGEEDEKGRSLLIRYSRESSWINFQCVCMTFF